MAWQVLLSEGFTSQYVVAKACLMSKAQKVEQTKVRISGGAE